MILGIFGAGGLGREVLETAKALNARTGKYEEIIFVADEPTDRAVRNTRVWRFSCAAAELAGRLEIIPAVGEPYTRLKIAEKARASGLPLATLIHPDVYIPESAAIGEGSYVGPGAFISCDVTIGDFALIQPRCAIAHDCRIGSNVVVSSMVAISGTVVIGDNTYIGAGTSVIHGCTIGRDCIIRLGSVVDESLPDSVIAAGNPARVLKSNDDKRVFS